MVLVAVAVVSPEEMKSELNDHFGMAEDFALFDYDDGAVTGLRFISNDPSVEGAKTNADVLVVHEVKIVLAGAIGPHMLAILLDKGVRVFKGALGTLEDAIEDYKAGMLVEVRTAGEMF
ncbi:MAG TPA: NifB/NifX family molybdenum-iron cluster-binding protein [Methanocella sp.]|nr:NifB/NifX family molybdenum-iron cluster-binding protein [Methanocella sp.]